jgi:hypothetical protein
MLKTIEIILVALVAVLFLGQISVIRINHASEGAPLWHRRRTTK